MAAVSEHKHGGAAASEQIDVAALRTESESAQAYGRPWEAFDFGEDKAVDRRPCLPITAKRFRECRVKHKGVLIEGSEPATKLAREETQEASLATTADAALG